MEKMDSDFVDGIDDECDDIDCIKTAVVQRMRDNADMEDGVLLNREDDVVDRIADGLVDNFIEYGKFICPCRSPDFFDDVNSIVCPCDYYQQELEDRGYCLCGMYFSVDD